jgi:predicted DNA-binding transcriptional regulator YafY
MFSGEPETVTLRFGNNLIGVVYDKFGENTKMLRVDEDSCIASVTVQVSPTFWGWLFQFGERAKVTAPTDVVELAKQRLDTIRKQYD